MQLSVLVPSLWNLPLGNSRPLSVFLEVRAWIRRSSIWGLRACMEIQQKHLELSVGFQDVKKKSHRVDTWLQTPTYSIVCGSPLVHLFVWRDEGWSL